MWYFGIIISKFFFSILLTEYLISLQFQTNLDYDDPTEIVFSTSRMPAKLFKTLTVEPESNIRVYIRLIPLPSREIQEFLDSGNQRDPDLVEKKTIEIYVNC